MQKTAREFADRELAPRADERDRKELFPGTEMRALGELGLLGANVPANLGGSEVGPVALSLALTEIARGDASVAVTMGVTNMVGEIIARFGSDEQKRKYLPALCSGENGGGAFALSEPQSGSDPSGMLTTATRIARGFTLRGSKMWISSGDRAGVIIVFARNAGASPPGGKPTFSAFVVEGGTRGLSVGKHEHKMGLRGSSTVGLTFDDLELPPSALLGREGDGLKIAFTALDGGRIGIASQAIGVARAALETALKYSGERRQFDRPISGFQGVQFMLADSATALDAGQLLIWNAAWRKENGLPFTREAAEAKLYATERAFEVCDRAVQILGGYGYTREFPVERHLRDVRVTTIYEGTSQMQRIVIARNIVKEMHA